MSDEGLKIAQCWFGVEKDGRESVNPGNNGGFEDALSPLEEG
jgi:hypothetical protein